MYDAALYYGAKAERESHILANLGLESKSYVLATIHRAENTDEPNRLQAIFRGLASLAGELPVLFACHPRTRAALSLTGNLEQVAGELRLIDPVGYLDMIVLEKNARMIATDSGGVQKEAFFYQVPCVTLRDETEWVELVELGWNRIVPPQSPEAVARVLRATLGTAGAHARPYGDGNAARRIVAALEARKG